MKWEKLGMIFSCEEYNILFAKSPQVLEFDDFVRVYFSSCESDNDKYISSVCYVDYKKDFSEIVNKSFFNVMDRGRLGCYDEHGIFPFSPFRFDNRIIAYLSGWTRRVSVSCDSGIGIAESFNGGNTFVRLGNGPILTSSLDEPFLVIDAFVRYFNNSFHMWYIFGTRWVQSDQGVAERIYKIAHAVSNDGINWKRDGKQIIFSNFLEECQALPCVFEKGGIFHMYFCYRHAFNFRSDKNFAYKIGYAFSEDLTNWTRDDALGGMMLSDQGWDSEMMCYPNVCTINNQTFMLYNGNHFGKYGFGLAKLIE